MSAPTVSQTIQAMAEMYGRTFSGPAATMYRDDLSAYPDDKVLAALNRARKTLRYFPSVAEVISLIQAEDGRPGVEEAWALCPKSEADSVVWNDEISGAYFVALPALENGDKIGARMAFKEKYETLVREAREIGKPVKWWASQGEDALARQAAVMDAVSKGRISLSDARETVPELGYVPSDSLQITGPAEEMADPEEVRKMIAETIAKLTGGKK